MGAIAKGYAVEQVCRQAPAGLLVSVGGNVRATGPKADGQPWVVGIQSPDGDGEDFLHTLELSQGSVVTSGDYQRYYTVDGVRYHHIIDPETGYPADSGLKSVTVISADHLLADALSTALFVAGPEEALEFWRSQEDFELVLCTEENQLLVTEGLEAGFTFTGEELGYDCQIIRR